jgi:prolyl 4-hydroxylase
MDAGTGAKEASDHPERFAQRPPLRERSMVQDDFLPVGEAEALRKHVERHFSQPHQHRPSTHQVWNYWHVPQLYTYLRTLPEKLIPHELCTSFHDTLSAWARETLGMPTVTWPTLSLYVNGCWQGLHNDSGNGRFGYVYSLTPDTVRHRGGETMLLREGDLFRDNLSRSAAGSGLYDLIAPRFNRLTVFDDRIPHGVQRIEGSMEPLDGRIVLHGHIREAQAVVRGPLTPEAVSAALAPLTEAALAADGTDSAQWHGPLTVRLNVSANGSVEGVRLLVDRVAKADGASAVDLVEDLLGRLASARLPSADGPSEAIVPIMLGGPAPWMQGEGYLSVTAKPAAPTAPREPETLVSTRLPARAAIVSQSIPDPQPRADNPRVEVGASVRARLATQPKVARIPKDRIEAFVVRDFLDAAECSGLIALIDEGRAPSGLMAPSPDPEFRTSETCNLLRSNPLVAAIESRIDALMGLHPSHGEGMQGQRYAVGQQFKAHHDFFHTDQPYWPPQERAGGQRTWTVMAFLNLPEAGGQTLFPQAGLKITPAAGYLLIWNNLRPDGEPNPFSLHQGLPVEAGVKYVTTKWYRERPWTPAAV